MVKQVFSKEDNTAITGPGSVEGLAGTANTIPLFIAVQHVACLR